MPIPEKQVLYCEKNGIDRTIDSILSKDGELTAADLNRVDVAAQIQAGIERYRAEAASMSNDQLRSEEHNSARLGSHLIERFGKRPSCCRAHAIVAGKHKYSARLRLLMAKLKIRIDDTDNGCWLPENTAATPHPSFPKAVPHSRIHRFNYYFFTHGRLISLRDPGHFRNGLNIIGKLLQYGPLPDYVMLRKGQGLPPKAKL
jgi:hypothetical protein